MGKTTVQPGDIVTLTLPHSEVCMFMNVAGHRCEVQIEGPHPSDRGSAFLLFPDGCQVPVLLAEAGVLRDSDGTLYINQ